MGSFGERMFKRARGTDVAGKRLPRQTIPKSVLSDEDKDGRTLHVNSTLYSRNREFGQRTYS